MRLLQRGRSANLAPRLAVAAPAKQKNRSGRAPGSAGCRPKRDDQPNYLLTALPPYEPIASAAGDSASAPGARRANLLVHSHCSGRLNAIEVHRDSAGCTGNAINPCVRVSLDVDTTVGG